MRQWQPRLGVWAGERVEGLAELEQQLAIAIFTPLGSREGQPEFGSLVHDAVDDTLTNARLLVSREVQRVVKRWVPRVVLISVGATQDATGRLVLEIKWRPRDIEAAAQQLLRVVESERPAISTPGTAPVFTLLPTMTGDVLLGSTLTCDVGEYSGTDPVFVTYAWRRDGVPIVGATLASYEVTLDDLTDLPEIDCLVTLQNAIGVTSEATDAVEHVPIVPSFTTAPVIAGTFLLGETLVCIGGTWTGTAPLTVARQWFRSGEPISGATNITYVVQVADMLSPLTCEVTVTNMAGSDVAMSAERSTDALPPTFTMSPSISGTYAIGEVLTCAPGEWTGTELITVEYQWHRDGVAIVGEDESTYTVVSGDYVFDTELTCVVTLTNDLGSDVVSSGALVCPVDPVSIFGAAGLDGWYPPESIVHSGGLVTSWTDASGNGHDMPAAGSLLYEAAHIDGRDAARSTGPAFLARSIGAVTTWPNATIAYVSRVLAGGSATGTVVLAKTGQLDYAGSGAALFGSNATPTQTDFYLGGTNVTGEALPASTVRITVISGTTSRIRTSRGDDISRTHATAALAPDQVGFFARATGAISGSTGQNIALSEVVVAKVGASAGQYAALDAYFRARYPGLY